MNKRSTVVGTHAFFAREGDTHGSSDTVAVDSKPAQDDSAWIDFGVISETGVEPQSEEKEIWGPSPGQLRLVDVIETKRAIKYSFTAKEMSPLMFELLFGTEALDSGSSQFNPLEGATKKGWLKVQKYDHKDALVSTVDVWVHIKIASEVSFGEDEVSFEVEARTLHSTLNTGSLS
jgi:hypothetical protein